MPVALLHQRDISVEKPNIPGIGPTGSLNDYDGPVAFCIPGNHDWMDGLEAFLRNICCRDWLGGWLLPQVSVPPCAWHAMCGFPFTRCCGGVAAWCCVVRLAALAPG